MEWIAAHGDQLGVVGLCILFVIALATGRLYTKSQVDRAQKSADDAVERAEHDRDEWRTESRIKDQQLMEKDDQLRHLAEVGELQKSLVTEVRAIAHERRRQDANEVTS